MKTIRTTSPIAVTAVAAAALLSGCATPYVPAKGEKMASVAVAGHGTLTMCRNGQRHSLWPEKGAVQVPVDTPIQIASRMQSDGGNVTWTCASAVEFTALAGSAYVVNDGFVAANRCYVELVRQDVGAPNGVSVEPTARRGTCR